MQAIFGGHAEPAPIPMGLSWSFKDVGFKPTPEMSYPYDPARAKKLLADAGLAQRLPARRLRLPAPRASRGQGVRRRRWPATGRRSGVKTKLIPVDYPAFRKNWVDRKTPGVDRLLQHRQPDWIGAYALLEKMAYSPSQAERHRERPRDRRHDRAGHEADGPAEDQHADAQHLHAAAQRAPRRCRSRTCTRPYATSKTLGKWNPGTVMYDLFLDDLAASK